MERDVLMALDADPGVETVGVPADVAALGQRVREGQAPRHRLWTGPSARTHAGQLDVSQLPEILRAQRRHLAQRHHHPWQCVEAAVSDATRAIYQALRTGIWIPGQRQRLHQLAPGTWNQALASALGASPDRRNWVRTSDPSLVSRESVSAVPTCEDLPIS